MTITYTTAQLAKEKGFNVPTREYWTKERSNSKEYLTTGIEYDSDRDCIWDWNNNSGNGIASPYPNREFKYQCSAPEQSDLQKWLRKEHNIDVQVYLVEMEINGKQIKQDIDQKEYAYRIYKEGIDYFLGTENETLTYEQALEKGLLRGLELI